MKVASFGRRILGATAAFALCATSSGAAAATALQPQPPTVSPLVALSALASDASAAALCGASAAVAAGAAAAAQAAQPGCVLPVVDAPAPVAATEPLPPPPVAPPPVSARGGFGVSPLLLGLAAIAGAALLYFLLRDKKDDEDVSPS